MGARVLVVETVDVGHEEEVVGTDHGGSDGGQGVVVAEFDLRYGEGVVFVDDGNDAHVEQFRKGVLSVHVLCPVGDVVPSQEDLSNRLAHMVE